MTTNNPTTTSPETSNGNGRGTQGQAGHRGRRRLITPLAALVVGAIALAACGAASADSDALRADLTEFNDEFNAIAADRDVDAIVSLYADDALWVAPGSEPTDAQESARQTFNLVAENRGFLSHTVERLEVSDDGTQAVMLGVVDAEVESLGIDSVGTYLFVLERDDVDDEWTVVIDMFNQHAEEQP